MRLFSNMLTFNRVKDGEDGKQGAMLVPEGSWDENKTYLRDQYKTPIVEHEGLFYSLNKEGMTKGGLNPKDDYANNGSKATWRLQESYEMVIADTAIINGAVIGGFVFYDGWFISQDGTDLQGNPSTDYKNFPLGTFIPNIQINSKTGELRARDAFIKGTINANLGEIGGFEIGNGRIGAVATPGSEAFGNLAIYKDFFRIGGSNGYAMLGNDVIPSTAGGAFTASGRIVNNHPNRGSGWGFDQANYGLFIDVTGGTKNYGLKSNAALIAPSFINTAVGELDFNGSDYNIDFSQHSIFIMNRSRDGGVTVTMPSEDSVAQHFGMYSMPNGFGFIFTVVAAPGTNKITLLNIKDRNNNSDSFAFSEGDNATILVHKRRGVFEYQLLTYNT